MKPHKYILPIIVISQFFCTSLWFAGNGVMYDLMVNFNLKESALGYLTSSVQFGFIGGTLIFAFLSIADRFSPSKVFFVCALFGALFNVCTILDINTYTSILGFRFLTGFFLAGIYPVGMKIAADYYEKGLGKSLSFLVGALVIGTAFPHLLKDIKGALPWEFVLITTSSLAVIGGLLMLLLVPNGPYRKASTTIDLKAIPSVFKKQNFRSAAFGYFGHMWELYSFWAFVPYLLQTYKNLHAETTYSIPLLSFIIIGSGSIGCIIGGYLANRISVKKVAIFALLSSGICCVISPFLFSVQSEIIFFTFLIFWGMVVIADSPLFSTMVAQNAPSALKGTALTIVNCIGFLLTIFSIQLIDKLRLLTDNPSILVALAIGPFLGLVGLMSKGTSNNLETVS
ncbi:MFS transporter [Flammeovirga kamogawensis]|uniref:MFS transporter n=1 Tax=Flammeovirga kamogawensis TaxID=373891 RepID=A0ABX8H3R5_9BACT|nr:MFS transporter [Flammeovirga kamogawensis]MBB6460260.1 MFS family permease [Flammeovirga kamogawensis]QWG10071.1 MFS transporter [Flammeovirga kamogawensis]TRX65578.1 MFS transporter [Flammeovirga kamogawensis]